MTTVIVGLVAIGAVVALRPVVRRGGERMREHCAQMAAKCKEMMAQSEAGGATTGMHEHCQPVEERVEASEAEEVVAA